MDYIIQFVEKNSEILFRYLDNNKNLISFDKKGFHFTNEAQIKYNEIKNEPHLYVAFSDDGVYYIGKSFQRGGRWKRQHAYHLGTLAHYLLNTMRYDDQNHQHWIDHWMKPETINEIIPNEYTMLLKSIVRISFIPFQLYAQKDFKILDKLSIRKINSDYEKKLIEYCKSRNTKLLNVQNNR